MTRCFPSASLEMRASREIREFLCLYVIKLHPMNVEGEEEGRFASTRTACVARANFALARRERVSPDDDGERTRARNVTITSFFFPPTYSQSRRLATTRDAQDANDSRALHSRLVARTTVARSRSDSFLLAKKSQSEPTAMFVRLFVVYVFHARI